MIKKILKIIRRIIVGALLLYAFNKISYSMGIIIPINIISLTLSGIFGLIALPFLLIVMICIF